MAVIAMVALGATAWAADSPPPAPKAQGASPTRSGYLAINGLKLYYEVYGTLGQPKTTPLLLIPGGFMATDAMKPWAAAVVAKRPVIVFDRSRSRRALEGSRRSLGDSPGDFSHCAGGGSESARTDGDLFLGRCASGYAVALVAVARAARAPAMNSLSWAACRSS
jgi:hypothetical protein